MDKVKPNMMTTDNVQQISEILQDSPLVNGFAKCEQCGCRPKLREKGETRKWCRRCIAKYYRHQHLSPQGREQAICDLVGSLYWDASLEQLEPHLREALENLRPDDDVFLFGPVGTGKTYAMGALIRHYVSEGFECARICFDDFCVAVRSTMSPASKLTERDMVAPLTSVDRLFIDDLGLRSKAETDFAYVTLYTILNKRQEQRLPTFVSSNKDIERLAQSFDGRIADRLRTAVVIEMGGQSRRRQKRKLEIRATESHGA